MLSLQVITADHELEAAVEQGTAELARHRWHWTLDESNPGRVSVSEYARQIGRNQATVYVMVKGYAQWAIDSSISLDDQIGRARFGGETGAAAEAVAKARGLSVRGVSDPHTKHHNEVRRVRDLARDAAERHGTTVEAEAPKIAEAIVRHEQAEAAGKAERAERADLRFIELEGYLIKAKRELLRAVKLAPTVPWDDESRVLLAETTAGVGALLALIDTALSGVSGVDWDAELAKVAGDENQ